MDVVELQNKIVSRPEYIEQLLDTMGFENIQDKGEYYSCQNIGGDNPHAIAIYKDNLHYENFSHGSRGNLLTLVMETKGCSFPESIEYTAKTLGIKSQNIRVVLPFGGFYKDIIRSESDSILDMKHYSERDLPPADALSFKFLKDGVSLQVQHELGIRYSHEDDAVLIPIYDVNHQLVGCKARNNDPDVGMDKRWFMYIPYKKNNIVYGLDVNYANIFNKQRAVIFEAEKSVMQTLSFDMKLGLAIGGHSLSKAQIKQIKTLNAKEVIVAFDQDLEEEEIIYEAKKLKINNECYANRVFYIYDRTGEYLPKGSKMSPSDRGKDIFVELLKHCKYEVE